ncbi:hypothetical protein BKA66DRAFT_423647 [Pyrenochaeta sp. MPI-SDFR-AT-0127]|nr:hypothetical protein BKA66DRAFT_423647 [Pyrenochaeta sp. MPI-SDFR-AT-0127]
MELLEMPPEVFQRIVQVFVNKFGIVEAWKLRGTCKAFCSYFDYEILAKPKLNAYIKNRLGRKILNNYLAKFLFLRSIKLNGFVHDFLPNFIRDTMLEVSSCIKSNEAETALRKALCELLVKSNTCAYSWVLNITNRGQNQLLRNPIDVTNPSNRVAAAAAAGNLERVQELAFRDHHLMWKKSAAFGYPLDAAVYAGHLNVVQVIAQHAVHENAQPGAKSPAFSRRCFTLAICTGIELQRYEISKQLIQTYDYIFGFATHECMETWLQAAVKTGDERLARIVLNTDSQASIDCLYNAFDMSCRHDYAKIALQFFEAGRLRLDEVAHREYPLLTAIFRNSMPVVQALLDLGANPDGPSYLENIDRPLHAALKKEQAGICRLLFLHGAKLDLVPVSHNTIAKLFFKSYQNSKSP